PTAPRGAGFRGGRSWREMLGQGDDDARGAAEVAEQEGVLELVDLADEFAAVGAQAGHDVLDVVDGEHDAAQAERVRRGVFLGGAERRVPESRQLELAVAVRG